MPNRSRVTEILNKKQRSGVRRRRIPDVNDIQQLKDLWINSTEATKPAMGNLVPIRMFTLIEVFCRYWIEILIDRGPPCAERASGLKGDLKFDFEVAHSLEGRALTLGQVISHGVSLSNLEAISTAFSTLIADDLFRVLAGTRSRPLMDEQVEPPPMIDDMDALKRRLVRLIEVRHILVHEFPAVPPHEQSELDELFDASEKFLTVMDEALTQLLWGPRYTYTQHDMTREASEKCDAATTALHALCDKIASKWKSKTIYDVQGVWETFKDMEAERQAEGWTGGTGHSLIFYSAAERITQARITELQNWIDDEYFKYGVEGLPDVDATENESLK
jgi:hypothetical protein